MGNIGYKMLTVEECREDHPDLSRTYLEEVSLDLASAVKAVSVTVAVGKGMSEVGDKWIIDQMQKHALPASGDRT